MKRAKITLISSVSETDEKAIADLVEFKKPNSIRVTKAGARKVTATFNWMECGTGYARIKGCLAIAFMHYLDQNRKPDKMCLSNDECADIDKAFAAQDWAKLNRYAEKYLK